MKMTDKRKSTSKSPAASPAVSTENRGLSIIKKLQLVRTSSIADKFRNRSNDSESREEENQMSVSESQLRTQRAVSDGDLTYIDQLPTDDENQSTVTSLPSIVFVKDPLSMSNFTFYYFFVDVINFFRFSSRTKCLSVGLERYAKYLLICRTLLKNHKMPTNRVCPRDMVARTFGNFHLLNFVRLRFKALLVFLMRRI